MIVIIGAGLSGLLTGYRLKQWGEAFRILEARDRIGGRIHTVTGVHGTPMEMGATWFTPQHHQLRLLLKELNIAYFPQYSGSHYYYYEPGSPRNGSYPMQSGAESFRISGGTWNIIKTLSDTIGNQNILLNSSVTKIKVETEQVVIHTSDNERILADKVIITIPPKVWASTIVFDPLLPQSIMKIAEATQTWMEDASKVALEFAYPFWRDDHEPGILVSNAGPFIECYDHSNMGKSQFSLCGFINPLFNRYTREERLDTIKKQLVDIYGRNIDDHISYAEYIWQNDPLTKANPGTYSYPHQNNGNPIFRKKYFDGKVIFSGSETAESYAGYMEGAVISVGSTLEKICK